MSEQIHKYNKPIIGITLGDFNGIGPEIIIKSLSDKRILKQFIPIIYGNKKIISHYKNILNQTSFDYYPTTNSDSIDPKNINVLNISEETVNITPGNPTDIGGQYAFLSLKVAVNDLKKGKIDAITTAPISKELIKKVDPDFVGHTEYLTLQAEARDSLMFLVHDQLKVGLVTEHISLNQVSEFVSQEKITKKMNLMIDSLKKDFGIQTPKIAVMGLNPHAGENGMLGKEEQTTIEPVIKNFQNDYQIVTGPFSADGFFGTRAYLKYDAVLAMYHDQGLIPFKSITFGQGVNFTAGLPYIRTSPDHGTAFDIAGKNRANESSFRQALYLACDIYKRRVNKPLSHKN